MSYRDLPSVERLVRLAGADAGDSHLPHAELVAIARSVLAEARAAIGRGVPVPELDELARDVARRAAAIAQPRLRPIINATGVVIQTNLGRAPLSAAALQALQHVAGGYSNLEYDLDAGERGSRYDHMTSLLVRLTGAEAALAVNNNAAAVLLVLACFCAGRDVLVSAG